MTKHGADVVVIGAGSAGAALAARFSEDAERSVTVLEAGPHYPDFDQLPDELKYGYSTAIEALVRVHDWRFVGRPTGTREMAVPRGKVTGGTSAINGQIFLRGLPEDYDGWAAAGNDGWCYDDVLPYLIKLEDDRSFGPPLHGRGGPIGVHRYAREEWLPPHAAFYEACRAAGYPDQPNANAPDATGTGAYPLNNPESIRISTALGYLPHARPRPNFTLLPDTFARRIVLEGRHARGVEVEVDGAVTTIEAGEVIVSAGAIGSPQLLMLSGIGPADQLEPLGIPLVCDLPGVGQNLQDHPVLDVVWRMKPEYTVGTTMPRVQVMLRYTGAGSDKRDDMILCSFAGGDEWHLFAGLFAQVARGELRLVSADPAVGPSLDYRLLEDDLDLSRMREAVRLCVRLAQHESVQEIVAERLSPTDADLATDEALDEWLIEHVSTGHHVTGTCRMGPSGDAGAVVDSEGRVHGVECLRVVDASIMPTTIRANTNATTIAIAERLADAIRGRSSDD